MLIFHYLKNASWKDRLIFLFIFLLLLYALTVFLLQGLGIINTPRLLDISPHVAAVLAITVWLYHLFGFFLALQSVPGRVQRIAIGMTRLEKDMEWVKESLKRHDVSFSRSDGRLIQLENRVSRLEGRKPV